MKFNIHHRLEYRFSRPVFLEPHFLFLTPRSDGVQTLLEHKLAIQPNPVLSSPLLDAAGNTSRKVWFEGTHDALIVEADMTVDTLRKNPFDYLIDPSAESLPSTVPAALQPHLAVYLQQGPIDKAVKAFSDDLLKKAKGRTQDFLPLLTREIHSAFPRVNRDDGAAWQPARTLKENKGACRDLSLLWIQAAQVQGLAARFVSGYYEADEDQPEKDLHAWAEAFVEGGGWRGYDPSNGLAVADRHVALAAHERADKIPPVLGSYRGTGAEQKMNFSVTMKRV